MSEQGQQTSPKSAIEKRREAITRIGGSFADVKEANTRLMFAAQVGHLLSPVPQFTSMPDGLALALSVTTITKDVDTFRPGGPKNALLKPALLKIADGLGIVWDTERCYVRKVPGEAFAWEAYAEGVYIDPVSLQKRVCFGTVVIDLGDGSPECPKSEKERDQKRKFIVRDAESKAINRAIRMAAKLRSAYTDEELDKPFVAVRVVEVRPQDPDLAREYDRDVLRRFRQGHADLFGRARGDATRPALPDASAPRRMSMSVDFDEETGEVFAGPPPSAARDATPKPTAPKAQSAPRSNGGGKSSGKIMFGNAKGTAFADAEDSDLTWYAGALRKSIADESKADYRDANQRDLDAVETELARRRGEDAEPEDDRAVGSPDDY